MDGMVFCVFKTSYFLLFKHTIHFRLNAFHVRHSIGVYEHNNISMFCSFLGCCMYFGTTTTQSVVPIGTYTHSLGTEQNLHKIVYMFNINKFS